MPEPVMKQIHNIVVLMLENRSLDNVLGYLYPDGRTAYTFPANGGPYQGLNMGKFTNPAYDWLGNVQHYAVEKIPDWVRRQFDPYIIPWYNPTEEYVTHDGYGVVNQVFGNQDKVSKEPPNGTPATMQGFLQDYYRSYMVAYKGLDILWMFTPDLLFNLHHVAWAGAVSDTWFCSVPTQTNPNRAYSICGTSLGRENNAPFAVEKFDVPTIFNAVTKGKKSWGLYYEDIWKDDQNFTQYTFPQLNDVATGNEIAHMDKFFQRAKDGNLPAFTYLEPSWSYGVGGVYKQGNDFHPPASVRNGDLFVRKVFEALRASKQWSNTLFILTFDEHGGTYDHYGPPWGAVNPDGKKGPTGFDFNRFGVRVPTILVSPWVRARGVFRAPAGSKFPYDHTSLIRTIVKWCGLEPETAGFFKRMHAAPSFEDVLIKADNEAADNVSEIDKTMKAAPAAYPELATIADRSPYASIDITEILRGIPSAIVRAIFDTSNTPEEIHDKVALAKADPQKFEAALDQGKVPSS